MMLLGEHAIKELPVCTEDVSLDQVYEMLCGSDERIIVVVDSKAHQVPIGIVTDRSICEQLVRRRRDPRSLTAANVLDSNIKKLRRANLAASSPDVIDAGERPVIVVDRDRKLVGLYAGNRQADVQSDSVTSLPAEYSASNSGAIA